MTMSVITVKDGEELFSSPSLQDICIRFCTANAQTLFLSSPPPTLSPLQTKKHPVKLQKSVNLPNDIWEKLLENFDGLSESSLPLIHAVHHKVQFLRKIHIRNSPHLKDDQLCLIMENLPMSLDIHNCPSLTKKSIDLINKFGKNLESLCIGTSVQIIPTNIENWIANHKKEVDEEGIRKIANCINRFFKGTITASVAGTNDDTKGSSKPHGLFTTAKLRKLIIWGHHITQMQQVRYRTLGLTDEESVENEVASTTPARVTGDDAVAATTQAANTKNVDYWEYLTRDFTETLEYLDLSSCHEITDLSFLLPAKSTLISLQLHDVLLDYDEKTWGVLAHLSKLKFLDVSQYNELASVIANPDVILNKLVSSLPDLVGLDISGTNLAGFDPSLTAATTTSISGLASRKEKPLAFLGLLSTHYNASSRRNIPALQISGGSTIPQLLLALKLYLHRDNIIRKAVRILHERLMETPAGHNFNPEFIPCYTILDLLLDVISTHIDDKHTIIVSMAALFHVLKKIVSGARRNGSSTVAAVEVVEPCNICRYRVDKTFHVIVRAMEIHHQDVSLMRNGVLNMLLLTSRVNMNAQYAKTLVSAILNAGITIAAQSNGDIFMVKAIAHILYSVTHFEEKKIMQELTQSGVPGQLCAFMAELFNKRMLNQMPTFWIILLKFTKQCHTEDVNFYNQFAETGIVELSFKLINTCNEVRVADNEEQEKEMQGLREIQKPVLAFLTNMLYNARSSTVAWIIESTQMRIVFSIIREKNAGIDHDLLHVCCGFLAHVCSKEEANKLVNPSREEILSEIFRVMSHMTLGKKFSFTFRNLNQLYELLSVYNAPEIHLWALWTLVKLAEDNESFADIIVQDGKLNLSTLLQHYESSGKNSGGGSSRCFRKLEFFCYHLSNIIDTRYIALSENEKL